MNEGVLTQKARFIILLVEVGILCAGSYLAMGAIFPPGNEKGFWFYSGLLGLILGARLDTPFFAKPADVILYAAPAATALLLGSDWGSWNSGEKVAFCISLIFCIVTAALGAVSILSQDAKTPSVQRLAHTARILAETLGNPRILFTVVVGFALYAFHRNSSQELGIIGLAWALTAILSPLEGFVRLGYRLRRIWRRDIILDSDGEVVAYQIPGIILIRQTPQSKIETGALVAILDPLGKTRLALALDFVGRDEGVLLRTIEVHDAEAPDRVRKQIAGLPRNSVAAIDIDSGEFSGVRLVEMKNSLVGLVAPETSIETLFFEVVSKNDDLEEGRLVEVQIGHRTVTYQIVNGFTKEEVVYQKNTFGYARAQAQKIGEWNENEKRFRIATWLPQLNAPVYLKKTDVFVPQPEALGHFPGTNYPVSIKNIDQLVTHNTAILGILGIGKSMLAIELVERMMAVGIKVICLDLTNQYANELSEFYDSAYESSCIARIQEAGDRDRDAWAENPEDGGSFPALQAAIREDLVNFLSDSKKLLKIYNPAQIGGTRQLSEPRSFQSGGQWQRGAALWSITPVEITTLVSETALELMQGALTDEAKVCLVYEEAHSLVPELNAVASQSDRDACNGTARAILQGRKFGLGCLLVTQRTANVTKTILNQCNSVFAMRTFDETGKEFLANYIGRGYTSMLPALQERHAVFFGRASSCENPVLIRLNNRPDFTGVFRRSDSKSVC